MVALRLSDNWFGRQRAASVCSSALCLLGALLHRPALFIFLFLILLLICAYKAWVISPPAPTSSYLRWLSPATLASGDLEGRRRRASEPRGGFLLAVTNAVVHRLGRLRPRCFLCSECRRMFFIELCVFFLLWCC
jgi:hypothetical protein